MTFFNSLPSGLIPGADGQFPKEEQKAREMWVSKPIYESLPYFYLLVGAVCLAASMYLNHWYWPEICFGVGLFCLVAGLVVWLKRRDHRDQDRRASQGQDL